MSDEAEPLEDDVIKDFDEFWTEIVCQNGEWDLDQVKRELHDYHTCIKEVPKVYMEITGNLLSKPNYLASEVIGVHDERCWFKRNMVELAARIQNMLNRHEMHIDDLRTLLNGILVEYVNEDEIEEFLGRCPTPCGD